MEFDSLRKAHLPEIPFWSIPMMYSGATIVLGLSLPHLEYRYLADYNHGVTVPAAIVLFSSVAQGIMALIAIIFSLAFVMVQFSSTAYSPRLVLWLSRDPIIWHGLGIFTATFLYSLVALIWVNRWDSGKFPFFSGLLVILLLIASVMVLGLLVQRLALIQVTGVMRFIAEKARSVIGAVYEPLSVEMKPDTLPQPMTQELPVIQSVIHMGEPMAIAAYDARALVSLAKKTEGLIVMPFALGDTVIEGESFLSVRGGHVKLPEVQLRAAVRLARERTFEQDPKYGLRLLVDIAIRALSPAVNDPTTAVQALDYIEDLLRRLGSRHLDIGNVRDQSGILRLIFPTPTWEDFLSISFDEIRFYGATSLQVMRRLRTALFDLASAVPPERQSALRHYIEYLDVTVKTAIKSSEDQASALQQDRQGLGLSRR